METTQQARQKRDDIVLECASPRDIESIHRLLVRSNLPLDGFNDHIGATVVARKSADPRGVVGNATLELYGSYALLRSVAVDERERGQGLGQTVTGAALDIARERGVRAVYLLTETAGGFFPRFGFRPVERDDIPAEVRRSVEFTTACPTSALAMKLDLTVGQSAGVKSGVKTQRARLATPADAATIAAIYNQGIEDRVATFETRLRTEQDILGWFGGMHPVVVVEDEHGQVIAFASTSGYRPRECYAGVAEFSVYVARDARGRGAGRAAMEKLIEEAERAGFWKMLSRIFPENTASRELVRSVGFREVGTYEKHAQLDGIWRDVVIVERLLPANLL